MQVTLVPFGACVGFGAPGPPAGEPSTVQRRASWERTGRSVLGGAWPRGGSLQSPGNRLRGRNHQQRRKRVGTAVITRFPAWGSKYTPPPRPLCSFLCVSCCGTPV